MTVESTRWLLKNRSASDAEETVARMTVVSLDAGPAEIDACRELLAPDEQARAARFVFERDRHRFIVAHARLREVLGEELAVDPRQLKFEVGPHGKPRLATGISEDRLQFNLSHSGELALIGVTRKGAIGVDIEVLSSSRLRDEIVERMFSVREREEYGALPPQAREAGFFNCWTRKEAFVKAVGDGLSYPLDRFDVSLAPGKPARLLRVEDAVGNGSGWCLAGFQPAPGYAAAVVVKWQSADSGDCEVYPEHVTVGGRSGL